MCGICGIVSFANRENLNQIDGMLHCLRHRGPDGMATFHDANHNYSLSFAHARLSIIDLSNRANQPMTYDNLTVTYNGEIYNFAELKSELKSFGYGFTSNSDSEVVLKALHFWGVEAYHKFNGMFAIAMLDKSTQTVTLLRDRLGVKPLFYYHNNGKFLFASELRAIKKVLGSNLAVDDRGLAQYLRYGYTRGEHTIYNGVSQLQPGQILTLDLNNRKVKLEQLWKLRGTFETQKVSLSKHEIVEKLELLLIDACKLRLTSDVPIGVFLSGGYDSSLVAGILSSHTSEKLNTFSMGFEDASFDEAQKAKKIANFLGTNHSEYYCTGEDACHFVKNLGNIWDEPFADTSAIPTALLSQFTSSSVKVALSADGGDEIFAGYKKYQKLLKKIKLYSRLKNIPKLSLIGQLLSNFEGGAINFSERGKLEKLKRLIAEIPDPFPKLFDQNQHVFSNNDLLNYFRLNKDSHNLSHLELLNGSEELDQMLFWDLKSYLPDNILRKVDRSSMAYGLEAREPLLDFRVVDFMSKINAEHKIENGEAKHLLKKIAHKYIPRDFLNHPKQGFNAPVLGWMRGSLKNILLDVLSEERLKRTELYNFEQVLNLRDNVLAKKSNDYRKLWSIFIYEIWLQNNT